MKILLINPYRTASFARRTWPLEPLGLLSLATYINEKICKKHSSIKISILDSYLDGSEESFKVKRGYRSGLKDEEINAYLKREKPDVIGVSSNYTACVQDSIDLIELAKKNCPKALTIIGGAHATIDHKDLIKNKSIDVVVRGEGEETLKEIVYSVFKKKNFKNITGITYKKGKKIIYNPERPLIPDINDLPIPDRSFVNYPKYLEKTAHIYFAPAQKPVGTIFSARGCMYRCIFCSTHKVWGDRWRSRTAKKVIQEIEYLKRKYGVKEIAFEDDQFMGDKQRVIDICKLIIKKNLGMTFIVPPGLSPSLLTIEIINLLKKAGFYRISFSIDVGTKKSAMYVRKPVNIDNVRSLIKYANHLGFWTYGFFVIGFPYEKINDLMETKKYAYDLKMDFVRFYIAQPHMGSDLYDEYLKKGWLNKKAKEHHTMFDSLFGTQYISAKKLYKIREDFENNYLKYHIKNHLTSIKYVFWEFLPKIIGYKRFFYLLKLLKLYRLQISITPRKKKK